MREQPNSLLFLPALHHGPRAGPPAPALAPEVIEAEDLDICGKVRFDMVANRFTSAGSDSLNASDSA